MRSSASHARHRHNEQRTSDALQRFGRAGRQIHPARLGPRGRGREPSARIPRRTDIQCADELREFGGTRYNGNSIFVFDIADLCIAHLGHLHHTLTPSHLADLGTIDVVMVPIDGVWTLNQDDMIEVLRQIKPKIIIPMHIFAEATLDKFLTRIGDFYAVRHADGPTVVLTRSELPAAPEIMVLPGR